MLPKHTRSVKLFCRIDVSALAAVMFVLIVVMMIAEFAPHHGLGPDLPHVSHAISMPSARRGDAMTVTIMRDGGVYFGATKVGVDQIHPKILDRLKDHTVERKVYIRADGRARYGTVKEVLEDVRFAGVEKVAFLANQRRAPEVTY